MKVLICGSRTCPEELTTSLNEEMQISMGGTFWLDEVISGGARGADQLAKAFAERHGAVCTEYLPDWNTYGKSAGMLRNLQMLEQEPDLVLALWDGKSKGTKHTIENAISRGITVTIINFTRY